MWSSPGWMRHRNRKAIFKSILHTCIFFLILTWSHGPFFFISSLEATSSLRTMTCFIEGRSVSLNLWDLYASTLKTEYWVKKRFPCMSSFICLHTYLYIHTSFINVFHLDVKIKALFSTFKFRQHKVYIEAAFGRGWQLQKEKASKETYCLNYRS